MVLNAGVNPGSCLATQELAMLEIQYLDDFVEKCRRMIEEYPEEAKYLADAIYHLVYLSFFAGYIRGKDPDFDYNKFFVWIFGGFSTDEWKEVEGEVIREDEDYFRTLNDEAFQLAEKLHSLVKKFEDEQKRERNGRVSE